jgi:hypothetical protein
MLKKGHIDNNRIKLTEKKSGRNTISFRSPFDFSVLVLQ